MEVGQGPNWGCSANGKKDVPGKVWVIFQLTEMKTEASVLLRNAGTIILRRVARQHTQRLNTRTQQ
jgi:hypothetical protein